MKDGENGITLPMEQFDLILAMFMVGEMVTLEENDMLIAIGKIATLNVAHKIGEEGMRAVRGAISTARDRSMAYTRAEMAANGKTPEEVAEYTRRLRAASEETIKTSDRVRR